ncbi:MAG: hypothetical protein NT125_07825 [Candidatus Bipolaricaulota bacterium]|nr:hypothetical protein [Candidatus Bipolaricaulota bacterium]
MSEQEKEFSYSLGDGSRFLVKLTRIKKEVTNFVVQVSSLQGSTPEEMLRIDTYDTGPHKHVFIPGEEPRRVPIEARYHPVYGWAALLTASEAEAKEYWERRASTFSDDVKADGKREETS